MTWVVVVLAFALAGVVVLALYAVSLAHKVADLKTEIDLLSRRGDELNTLLAQLELPAGRRD